MATSTLQIGSPGKTRWVLRSVLLAAALVIVALAAVVGWLYLGARSALPQLDGTITLPGLSAAVTVTRDTHGVPTIDASSLHDLFFAQGYVTAQDRLWQMDVMRRYAGGEISEILGPKFIAHDREQRILGLRAAARHALQGVSPRDREFFEDYARGVNAYIDSHLGDLPLEFRILRYSPKIWTMEDSILMGARMVQDLNHYSYRRALEREKILAKLGPELTADLYVNSSWRDHPPSAKSARIDQQQERDGDDSDTDSSVAQADTDRKLRAILPITGFAATAPVLSSRLSDDQTQDPVLVPGSNNWVVSGEHTVTGKPLLSNDMHLGHQMPNLWYEAHLRSGNFDVIGVTLPGTPFVIVGHNQRIAWGFTNVGPTVEDVYIENFNDAGQYQAPSGWIQPEHRHEVIHVKGAADVSLDVISTRHGPVMTELLPGEKRKIALRWTLYDSLQDPFFDVDSAQNWQQFRRAVSMWDSPSQNAVFADIDGHIGYQTTGHIPIRAAGDGTLPVSGNDNAHEWTGYIPFDDLPHVYDPPTGILATANGRITPDGYKFSISTEWGSPWRTDRIYRVLESGKKFAGSDMLELQTDIYSAFDRFCAERFVYALDHSRNLSARVIRARELLRDWDGRMSTESAAATISVVSRQKLTQLLLEPKLGPATKPLAGDGDSEEGSVSWKNYEWFMSSVWLENVLLKQPKRWLPEQYSSYEALLQAAVEAAVDTPGAPADIDRWNWGKYSPIDIEHPVFSQVPFLARWTGPEVHEQSGGGYTVKQVGRSFGPSERMTVDLAHLDQTTLNTVTGQGGNLLSPYYMDQWTAWYTGSTFPLPFSDDALKKATAHQLRLMPGR
ncbi:MAG TPA: penicillin acylase family protein [Terriglobales bacterium]|nr:penicillin acylase family protein [Terriglobales bacterium]